MLSIFILSFYDLTIYALSLNRKLPECDRKNIPSGFINKSRFVLEGSDGGIDGTAASRKFVMLPKKLFEVKRGYKNDEATGLGQ